MFGFLMSLINPIGKAIDFASAYFNKKQDVDLEKYKVRGTVDVKAMETDAEIIRARVDLAKARSDDPTDRWGRRLIIYPWGIWFSLIIWRSVTQDHSWLSEYSWVIAALPQNLEYISYAVVAYLLAVVVKNSMVR